MGYNRRIVRWSALNDNRTEDGNTQNADGEEKGRFDYDGFWKDLVERFSYPLLKRALPELYEDADLSVKPTFLNKEFTDKLNAGDQKIHTYPHFPDAVLLVPLKNGEAEPVIVNAEAQGPGGGSLPEKMNFYRCLIYGHYRREPVSLAITTGRRPAGEMLYYSHKRYGTKIVLEYNNLVLAELDEEELASSDNPIDLVLLAAKFSQSAREELRKFNFLRNAVELLDEHGWHTEDKRDLLLFTERIVNMKDKELRSRYAEFIEQRNREGKSMYIPLMLRDSAAEIEQRGVEKGKIDGKIEDARNMLANGIAPELVGKITGLPAERIQELLN
jgi:hypothetical protein